MMPGFGEDEFRSVRRRRDRVAVLSAQRGTGESHRGFSSRHSCTQVIMPIDPKAEAARALHRFGFGPRGNTIADIAGDPRGAVLADLERRSAGRIANTDLPTSAQAARKAFDFRAERRAREMAARREAERGKMATPNQKP